LKSIAEAESRPLQGTFRGLFLAGLRRNWAWWVGVLTPRPAMILRVIEGGAPAPEQDDAPARDEPPSKRGVNLRLLFAIYAVAALAIALGFDWMLILRHS
jgi:hypothetical protein